MPTTPFTTTLKVPVITQDNVKSYHPSSESRHWLSGVGLTSVTNTGHIDAYFLRALSHLVISEMTFAAERARKSYAYLRALGKDEADQDGLRHSRSYRLRWHYNKFIESLDELRNWTTRLRTARRLALNLALMESEELV